MIHLNVTGDFAFNETLMNILLLTTKTAGSFINVSTFLIILFCSTKEMKDYKKLLLMYQLASSFLDFLVDSLSIPIIFFPYTAGTCQGWLYTVLGLNCYQIVVSEPRNILSGGQIVLFTYMAFALHFILVNLIFYRWQRVLPETSKLKIKGRWNLFLWQYGYLIFVVTPVPILYSLALDDAAVTRREFIDLYGDVALAGVDGFYFINPANHPSFIVALSYQAFWLIFQAVLITYCNTSIMGNLEALRNQMSATTRKMHLRFLRMVFIQTMIPMLQMQVPLFYWLTLVAFHLHFPKMQDVTTVTMALVSFHGATGSLFLLFFNKSYRTVLSRIFLQPLRNLPRTAVVKVHVSAVRKQSTPVETTVV